MIKILSSKTNQRNPSITELRRQKDEDNLGWLSRGLDRLNVPREGILLVLVGGLDPLSFRLRIAQAHIRHDFSPSHWSHVMLLGPRQVALSKMGTFEISLTPPRGFGFPAPCNALQQGGLRQYQKADDFPNIALLHLPASQTVSRARITQALKDFKKQRSVLDAQDLLLRWLAFAWGVGRTGNPLLEGYGIPSAAMLEVVLGTAGFDLTPGLESRSSCPEAIWQAAVWWHEYYKQHRDEVLHGVYCQDHILMAAQEVTDIRF